MITCTFYMITQYFVNKYSAARIEELLPRLCVRACVRACVSVFVLRPKTYHIVKSGGLGVSLPN